MEAALHLRTGIRKKSPRGGREAPLYLFPIWPSAQGGNNVCVHATKRLWIKTFKTRTGMLSNVRAVVSRSSVMTFPYLAVCPRRQQHMCARHKTSVDKDFQARYAVQRYKKSPTVMSRSSVISFPIWPSAQGGNSICVHAMPSPIVSGDGYRDRARPGLR